MPLIARVVKGGEGRLLKCFATCRVEKRDEKKMNVLEGLTSLNSWRETSLSSAVDKTPATSFPLPMEGDYSG